MLLIFKYYSSVVEAAVHALPLPEDWQDPRACGAVPRCRSPAAFLWSCPPTHCAGAAGEHVLIRYDTDGGRTSATQGDDKNCWGKPILHSGVENCSGINGKQSTEHTSKLILFRIQSSRNWQKNYSWKPGWEGRCARQAFVFVPASGLRPTLQLSKVPEQKCSSVMMSHQSRRPKYE